jgi:hypothetical protein
MGKRWITNIAAVLAWLLVFALALVVIATLATLFQLFIKETIQVNKYSIQILLQTYYVIMGMLGLGFLILMEHLLITSGIRQGLVGVRTLFIVGIELVTLGGITLAMTFYRVPPMLEIALTTAELVVGTGMIVLSRRRK